MAGIDGIFTIFMHVKHIIQRATIVIDGHIWSSAVQYC